MENVNCVPGNLKLHHINVQVQSLFNMFLSHTKEMFKKMNHIHPIGKNEGLVDDLGAEVSCLKMSKEMVFSGAAK